MTIFSNRIIELKKNKNLLQKNIANELGISIRAYQYYETGEREPTLTILVKLANYFDVSLDYLTGRADEPNNPNIKK